MKKIMVVADSHGRLDGLRDALRQAGPIDRLIHLGDILHDARAVADMAPCPVDMVGGNCDVGQRLPRTGTVVVEGVTIFFAHGDRHAVFDGPAVMRYAAHEAGATVALYGHTHIPMIDQGNGSEEPLVVNPGSITSPRQAGGRRSYALLTVDDAGDVNAEIVYVDAPH